MKKKKDTMISNIDILSKTPYLMKKAGMTISLPCSGSFLKGVLIRKGPEVAWVGASAWVGAEDGKDEFVLSPDEENFRYVSTIEIIGYGIYAGHELACNY